MRQPNTTKENRKGHTRSYYYRRKLVIAAVLLVLALKLIWPVIVECINVAFALSYPKNEGSISDHAIRSINYGVQNTPVVMIRSKLDDQLLHRFLEEHLYSCSEKELNDIHELDNRVKPPVYVYEGYYHSLSTSDTIWSKNPNPLIGTDFDKPASPPFTRAFYSAFRDTNKNIFDTLKYNLLEASTYYNNNNTMQEEDVCYLLAQWLERGLHFGDLSVQIHYGHGNEQKLISGAAWHTDAENSLLHLAITLRGQRVLHSKRMQPNTYNSTTLRGNLQHQRTAMQDILEEQTPGDAYLSSSTLMKHAPQFFDTQYSARVIAIHARFLYTSEEINHFRTVRTKESWGKLTKVLAKTLAVADLQMPSLEEVNKYQVLYR